VNSLTAIGMFLVGAILAVWATDRLLEGMVGLAGAVRLSTFAVGAVLSGFEAENVAVGVAAAASNAPVIALGTVFGGAMFLVCVALGLGAVLYPLQVRLPHGLLATMAAAPLAAGLAVVSDPSPRFVGVVLVAAFIVFMGYLVSASRRHHVLDSAEGPGTDDEPRSLWTSLWFTALGIVVISIGGKLVADGATRIVAHFGVSAALMGMVVTPAAIELEEIIRQAVPARRGHPEVSAGNLVGTLLYFLLLNLGLITLVAPVRIDPFTRWLDWPFLVASTWLAVAFLARGRVGRVEGGVLLAVYAAYVALHVRLP
jgi:cation:H+ antiporter